MPITKQTAAVQGALMAAMAIWGLNLVAVKSLANWFEPLTMAAARMVVACVVLTAIVWFKRCRWAPVSGRQIGALVMCGVLMVYLNQILFAQGITRSTATNAALIMALSPLVSSLIAAVAFGERLTGQRVFGVFLGFCGVAAVVFSHPAAKFSAGGLGDLLLVGGVVTFAAGGAIIQGLARQMHPLVISWAIYMVGAVLLVAQLLVFDRHGIQGALVPDWQPWALVVFSGVMATAVGNLIWNAAIGRIGIARTAVFLYWVPVFGVGFAALFLGEQLTGWHLAGFVAVMGGTYFGTRRPAVAAPVVPPKSMEIT
ncbi:MAG: DMT family transporter [Pseudomonadota bacterium]